MNFRENSGGGWQVAGLTRFGVGASKTLREKTAPRTVKKPVLVPIIFLVQARDTPTDAPGSGCAVSDHTGDPNACTQQRSSVIASLPFSRGWSNFHKPPDHRISRKVPNQWRAPSSPGRPRVSGGANASRNWASMPSANAKYTTGTG